ncbi:MAG: phospholipid carrier-dependent glycosyltransferase [Acidobacteria bacterium]|nr:MAG: phospholipid carrier-dependent glycosyltransferase [Acidobacteriota bacterium]
MQFLEATGINALLIVILTLLVALRLGRALVSRLSLGETAVTLEILLFAEGLGLGAISLLTLLLGALGLLYPAVFRVALGIGLAVSLRGLIRDFRLLRAGGPRDAIRRITWLVYPVIALLAGIVAICLLAALAPETGFDALNYHLGTPRLYIANHRVVETVNLAGYSHPLAVDMLYVATWLVHSPLAAKLVHFVLGLLTAAGCWLFCRRYSVPGSGLLAALLFLGSPVVMFLSQSAYIDLGLAFFALLAVFAWFRWLESGMRHWIVLAGIYTGLSLGAKYMGVTVLVVGLFLLAWAFISPSFPKLRPTDFFLYCAVAFLVFAPWLIKNVVLTGNPLAPALSDAIPTKGFGPPDYARLVQLTRSWHGYSGTLLDWVAIPWRQTFRPDVFHGDPGLVYLFVLPFALGLGWRNRWLRLLAGAAALGYFFLLLGTATTRFFVLIFPWMSILVAAGVWPSAEREGGRRAGWLRGALVLACLILVVLKLPWFAALWPTPEPLILDTAKIRLFRSQDDRDQFLESRVTGLGGGHLYKYLNGLPKGSRILALTPVYQALTDHEVFMPPNSTPSSAMAASAMELAKKQTGYRDVEINLRRPGPTGRFWKVRLSGCPGYTPDETHPRLFYLENSIAREVAVYGVTRRELAQGQEVVVDLGAPRRVERFTFLSRCDKAFKCRVFGSAGWSRENWHEVPASANLQDPRAVRAQDLLDLLSRNRITHVALGHHGGAGFLAEFYVDNAGLPDLKPVRQFEGYEVLEVTQGPQGRQRQGAH